MRKARTVELCYNLNALLLIALRSGFPFERSVSQCRKAFDGAQTKQYRLVTQESCYFVNGIFDRCRLYKVIWPLLLCRKILMYPFLSKVPIGDQGSLSGGPRVSAVKTTVKFTLTLFLSHHRFWRCTSPNVAKQNLRAHSIFTKRSFIQQNLYFQH